MKEPRAYLRARVWGGRPGAAQAFRGELLRVREGACLGLLYLGGEREGVGLGGNSGGNEANVEPRWGVGGTDSSHGWDRQTAPTGAQTNSTHRGTDKQHHGWDRQTAPIGAQTQTAPIGAQTNSIMGAQTNSTRRGTDKQHHGWDRQTAPIGAQTNSIMGAQTNSTMGAQTNSIHGWDRQTAPWGHRQTAPMGGTDRQHP